MMTPRNRIFGDAEQALGVIDVHSAIKSKDFDIANGRIRTQNKIVSATSQSRSVDFAAILPFVSDEYKISKDIKDYIFLPTPMMPSDLPNRNGVAFPLAELTKFRAELGSQVFSAWRGRMVHVEHQDNTVADKSIGVILDTALTLIQGYGQGKIFKIMGLLAVDRTKNPDIAAKLLNKTLNSVSMGAYSDGYACSYCGALHGFPGMKPGCTHISLNRPLDFYVADSKLVFRNALGLSPLECSIVADPAWSIANSDLLIEGL